MPAVSRGAGRRLRWFAAAAVAAMVGVAGAGWLAEESRRHWSAGQGYAVEMQAGRERDGRGRPPSPTTRRSPPSTWRSPVPVRDELRALDALTRHSVTGPNRR
jgi:hypothetical protein